MPGMTTERYLQFLDTSPGSHKLVAESAEKDKTKAGQLQVVGQAPDGYGERFDWNRQHSDLLFVVFLNVASDLGVGITNLKAGDVISILEPGGLPSFSKGNGKLIGGLIGLVSAAGQTAKPEAAPYIQAGATFAQNQFGQPTKGKKRDAYGADDKGIIRRCEGGVIVCLPGSGGPYYSTAGCIRGKDGEHRTNDKNPKHVTDGFFLVRKPGYNVRSIPRDGLIHLLAWDRKFEDNEGFYRLFVHLRRGDTIPPANIMKKAGDNASMQHQQLLQQNYHPYLSLSL